MDNVGIVVEAIDSAMSEAPKEFSSGLPKSLGGGRPVEYDALGVVELFPSSIRAERAMPGVLKVTTVGCTE